MKISANFGTSQTLVLAYRPYSFCSICCRICCGSFSSAAQEDPRSRQDVAKGNMDVGCCSPCCYRDPRPRAAARRWVFNYVSNDVKSNNSVSSCFTIRISSSVCVISLVFVLMLFNTFVFFLPFQEKTVNAERTMSYFKCQSFFKEWSQIWTVSLAIGGVNVFILNISQTPPPHI